MVVTQLERLYAFHEMDVLPDDDCGRAVLACGLDHIAQTSGQPQKVMRRMFEWTRRRAPWLSEADAEALIQAKIARPLKWTPEQLARDHNVTLTERNFLGLTQFGAVWIKDSDLVAKRVLREIARQVKVKRQRLKRRAGGAKPQSHSLAKRKPWLALGISRATYFRRLKRSEA